MSEADVIAVTRRWIADVVVGLNFCPFARRVFEAGTIRYAVTFAQSESDLIDALAAEVTRLAACPIEQIETTLLIHPCVLGEFLDYNEFLQTADELIDALGQAGVVQVASFHPAYRFADTQPEALENFTNRSPYPMLHLLREASVTAVADDPEALLEIPRRNVETLGRMGRAKFLELLRASREGR